MKIPTHKMLISRKVAIRLSVSFGVLLILVATSIAWTGHLKRSYANNLSTHSHNAREALTNQAKAFQKLEEVSNAAKIKQQLVKLTDTLRSEAGRVPAEPILLGWQLITKEDRDKNAAIKNRLERAAKIAADNVTYLDYQLKMVAALQAVDGLNGKNVDEQKKLAAAWQKMAEDIQRIAPPAFVQDVHKKLYDAVLATHAILAALPDLTVKGDYAGFAAKQKEMNVKIDAVRSNSGLFKALSTERDLLLAQELTAFRALTK